MNDFYLEEISSDQHKRLQLFHLSLKKVLQ